MNKLVFSALATLVASATGFANDTEWPELDRELAALNNAPLDSHAHGPSVSGWLIGAITSDDAPSIADPDASDNLGTGLSAARVNLSGSLGNNYSFVLGWDFTDSGELYAPEGDPVSASGTGGLTDANVSVGVTDGLDLTVGVFRRQFLHSGNIQRNQTLFIDRSHLGSMYSSRDAGLALSGSFNRVNWEVTATNGHDGNSDEFAYSAHVDFDIIGSSSGNEGAYGAADGANLNVGLSYSDDSSDTTDNDDLLDDGTVNGSLAVGTARDASTLGGYANFTIGGFSVWAEMADQDKDVDDRGNDDPDDANSDDGATPYSVGLAYLFGSNYEVAFRYDDWDDHSETTRYNVGLNRYIDGHDIKWQLNYSTGKSDKNKENENDVIALGIAVGF